MEFDIWWLTYPLLGLVVGFFAGLLGVGGGGIMVPMLTTLFLAQGFGLEQVVHMALGTSMATIMLTAVSSLRAHHAKGAVRWDIVRAITPGVLLGTFGGSFIAARVDTVPLAILHAADVGVSVESPVDVAKEAADLVLLRPDLDVLLRGVLAGRETFGNTLKYVLTTTSANLGNMLSMAAASVVLPFFPLLPGQILLNNFLSDIPALGLATDVVDEEWLKSPRRWDMAMIRRFMIWSGALSSAFDLLTFAVLLRVFVAPPELFRTGWFVESLLTELAVALVVRTRGPALRSRPGPLLLWSTQHGLENCTLHLVLSPVLF